MDCDWTCSTCGEAIGVYEPLVVLEAGAERTTSRLAEPALPQATPRWHLDCRPESAASSPTG
jgi:hypothetical protein